MLHPGCWEQVRYAGSSSMYVVKVAKGKGRRSGEEVLRCFFFVVVHPADGPRVDRLVAGIVVDCFVLKGFFVLRSVREAVAYVRSLRASAWCCRLSGARAWV